VNSATACASTSLPRHTLDLADRAPEELRVLIPTGQELASHVAPMLIGVF